MKLKVVGYTEKEKEAASWKTRNKELLKSHSIQLENTKKEVEDFAQQKLELEVKDLQDRHENEKNQIAKEIDDHKLRQDELEERLIQMADDYENLNESHLKLLKELDSWKTKHTQLERSSAAEIEKLKSDNELNLKNSLEQQASDLTIKFTNDRNILEASLNKLRLKSAELELKTMLFIIEIDRQIQSGIEKDKDLELARIRHLQLEQMHYDEIEGLKNDFENMLRSRIEVELREAGNRWALEKSNLDNQIKAMKTRLAEMENSLGLMSGENERLNSQLTDKLRETEAYKMKLEKQERDHLKHLEDNQVDLQRKLREEFVKFFILKTLI